VNCTGIFGLSSTTDFSMTQSQQNNFIITHIIYLPVLSRKSFKKPQEVQSPKYMYAPFMPEIFVAVVDELE